MKFSEKLKELRLKKGLTQQQLAEKLYVSRSAVAKWEQGRGYPSLELLERLAEIFDFSIDNLLSEKEYHSMTIKSNQMAENQTKYNKIIAVICCVVIAIIGILVGLYLALKKDFQQKVQFEEYAFCSIEIEKEGLTLTCVEAFHATCNVSKGYKFFLNNEQKRNLTVYNKLGNYSTVESLRSGYIGKFSFYSENDDKPQNIVGYRFDIIEDYVEGDYNINGFFFSTEPIEYPQAPIYTGKNDEVLEYLGEEESLGQRYPAFIAYSDGLQSWGNHIQLKNSETLFYSKILEYTPIYKQYSFDINVSNFKDLYIYALDNSEKGYSLATIIEKPTNGGTLLGKVFHLERRIVQKKCRNK